MRACDPSPPSYATCGSLDMFSGSDVPGLVRGKVLRVQILSNSGGYKGSYHPEGNTFPTQRDDRWYGPTMELVFEAAKRAGSTLNFTSAPDWVYRNSGSSNVFTQCIYAVELGYLDLCIGRFSITDKRSEFLQLTHLDSEPLYMVAVTRQLGSLDRIMRVLKPFEPQVWVTCIGLLVTIPILILNQDSVYEYLKGKKATLTVDTRDNLIGMYGGLRTFTDSSAYHEPTSWGGRVTSLALGIFVVLTVASYTSNLTNILVMEQFSSEFESLEDAVRQGCSICIVNIQVGELLAAFPNAILAKGEDGESGMESREDVLRLVEEGKCDVGLAFLEDFDLYTAEGNGAHCGLSRVGDPVFYGYVGMPIGNAPELQAMKFHVQHLLTQGYYARVKRNAKPPELCTAASQDGSHSFSMRDMMGIFVITGFLSLLGLVISAVEFLLYACRFYKGNEPPPEVGKSVANQRRMMRAGTARRSFADVAVEDRHVANPQSDGGVQQSTPGSALEMTSDLSCALQRHRTRDS